MNEVAAQIPPNGSVFSTNTQSGYKKSNQSKVFYHDSQWWAIAFNLGNNRWCIWRYDSNQWTKVRNIEMGPNFQWDAVIDNSTGKLYLFGSHHATPHFWRFSYIGGTWNPDPGYPRNPSNFANADQGNAVSLVRAKNGELWIFRIDNSKLQAKRSSNEGLNWSPAINIKTGLNSAKGTTDAVAFTFNGHNCVGVAYGEVSEPGTQYGFLFHRDGDPDTAWTDESAALTFFGQERALNNISMAADAGNNIYLLTRNTNASGNLPRNTLYKRLASGIWEKYKVNANTTTIWKSPAIAIDGTNNVLYCMGVNMASGVAEYKTCSIGQENDLDTADVNTLFSSGGASFDDLSAPAANVDAISGLMVCVDNITANKIWYRLLSISATEPVVLGAITLGSNEGNANTQYTIPLTLSSAGALAAGSGTLLFRFAPNTYVPDAMPAGSVLVNGTPAAAVFSGSKMGHVTVTTPVNLSNGENVTVVFLPSAGLLNPTRPGVGYRLTAWTSAQPKQVLSPPLNIVPTTTTVTPATVTPMPNEPDSCANYTISFKLGPQGRFPATGQIILAFDAATKITGGTLSGVTINGKAAFATGFNISNTIRIALPTLKLSNGDSVTLYLPATALCNPPAGNYTLMVSTSVETTPVASNAYRISEPLKIGQVLVAPAQTGVPASYTIPLKLSSNGALAGGVDVISFRFPAGTVVPDAIPANQITVDGVAAAAVISHRATREVNVTVPHSMNLANGDTFSVIFKTGAGLFNPANAGSYSLQAWSSVQTPIAASPLYALNADSGSAISTATQSGYKKANQSKVFYYEGQWWALAYYATENRWYIWKYNGTQWSRTANLDKSISYRWDAVLNAATGKLYLFGSHNVAPDFRRYSYAGGTWTKDAGYPVVLADFTNADQNNPVSLVRAKNGDLWIFRIAANKLQAKRSSDEGLTWSAPIDLKTGLAASRGTTDAVAFAFNNINNVGVAYGEADTVGSKYGFLRHRDGDPDGTWMDESAALTFFGGERALNMICATVDNSNNVYLITRNNLVSGSLPRNTLYKRLNTGAWEKFKVNSTSAHNWKSPVVAIDTSSGILYAMGVDMTSQLAEYKICPLGSEVSLETAPVSGLFSGGAFDDLSVPAANLNAISGLMVTVDNTTASDTWYRHLPISPASGVPVSVGTVTLSLNEVNANAQYTIPLTLSSTGALTAGSGVINLIFPNNTRVPNSMAAGNVLVDGVPASSIIVNSTTRQVSITVPVNLPDNHAFSVVFNQAAGLLNPTLADTNYKLIVWTSAQPSQVKSPAYSLVHATTTVTAATVTPFPTDADSLADYTLSFNLGNHGRLLLGTSTLMVKFGPATKVTHGVLSGVTVNNTSATAAGDSLLRKITVTAPAGATLLNNAAVTLFLPKSAIRNPAVAGNYTLTVATSVETTAVASNPYIIAPSTAIGAPIPGTTKNFDRNNQSKMFYHGGFWWVAAQAKADLQWYLWKFDGISWSQHLLIHPAAKNRPDCVLHASSNRAYILLPGTSTTYLTRLSYSGGSWSIDSGYPYAIPNFVQGSDRGINLVRAHNGDLWVFMLTDSTLVAKYSTNSGKDWSSTIMIKDSLNNSTGLTDAVAFSYSGQNHIGVGYAENSSAGAVFGFLRHKDSDADTVWTDETASIPQFSGTNADDHLSMAVHNNRIHMVVKTNGGGASIVKVGLLVRETNAVWSKYPIFLSGGWTRPTLAIDQTNSMLYVFGTRESGVKVGEMKKCALGNYAALLAAPIDTVFKNKTDDFFDFSVAAHTVTSATQLLVCQANQTRDEVWYNLITLGGAAKASDDQTAAPQNIEEDFEGVQVYPNPFNPNTSFRFKVHTAGPVKLQIFNLNGQLVKTLVDGELPQGVHQRRWNGRSQNGYPVASGIYLYRLQIGQKIWKGRIEMIK